ncbi:hypothetical protein [uncultured Paraglaciecola sp.]|uniref:hypothetical protein n=1 Tax=uncultured Paraglaciecola sp. TaxID=1765024 RepID=UPI0030D6E382|tara:strand:- start:316656 stop:317045 length:390 start_codon:yes stop_codon:yes gene_type:complete
MKFSYNFIVDPANKILICETFGEARELVDLEHLLKTIVKMAGKNQVKNVVLDNTEFRLLFSNIEIAKLLITVQENGWLGGLKVARIVKPEMNIENVIEGLAESLSLSIKNFETRSEAMLWLLFDKVRDK